MARIKVTAPLLNKRMAPVTDETDTTNVIGEVVAGFEFESVAEITNALGTWYRDRDGYYYWGGGVSAGNNQVLEKKYFSDHWFDELNILSVWNANSERGENATALILDSGINSNIIQLASALQQPVQNFVPGSSTADSIDPEFHGTHCASLIAARSKLQFIGAAPACTLLAAKITDNGALSNADTMKSALQEFLDDKYQFDIISISQELYQADNELEELIRKHIAKNRIVIASIGNDYDYQNSNFPRYPGCLTECISVGSCNNDKTLSPFSMYPSKTDIFCFGENIYAYQNSKEPGALTGTSQATAILAGISCLVISWLKKNDFVYNNSSIKDLFKKYSIPLQGNPLLPLIDPESIFGTLQKFKKNGNKNLQDCIDVDVVGVV
ncbi:MAG: S8/S53 family peptidase [Sediminibacterium sp.]